MKSGLTTSMRRSFLRMNLRDRILVSTLVAVIVTAAAGAQSVPAVSSAEARKATEAGYIEWAKARVALDMNTIEGCWLRISTSNFRPNRNQDVKGKC